MPSQFLSYSNNPKLGDTVIIYESQASMHTVVIVEGGVFQWRHGVLKHSTMTEHPYGTRYKSRNGNPDIFLLYPTPELWTINLPHRTQILYTPDISFISLMLELEPGKIVVESGTGSGSFSHALARAIGKNGHLFTYEYHELRSKQATEEFKNHGLDNIITVTHRDVCKDGFLLNSPLTQSPTTQPGSSENPCLQNNIELSNVFESDDFSSYDIRGKVDAVFLDLPEPWRAISHTTSLFQPSKLGRICCFSPCIEQVQKTYESLIRNGFTAVTMYETLKFDHVSTQLTFPDIQERIDNLRTSKIGSENKKRKVDNITETLESHEPEITSSEIYGPKVCSRSQFWESKGHTSYLTFAEYLPADFA